MVLWVAIAALAFAVAAPLLLALRRDPRRGTARAAVDIYRDQLGELDRDVDRGLIGKDEAAAARAEIARRLIRADAAPGIAEAGNPRWRNAVAAIVVTMPLAAAGLYFLLGSPDLPDDPLAARMALPPAQQDVAMQVQTVEQYLKQNPNDGNAWSVVAPIYIELGRPNDAVTAYSSALRVLGSSGGLEAGLGTAIVAVNNGQVTPDAEAAFERAAALSPGDPTPKVYLAVALEQSGRTADAIAAWQVLLKDAPADADWVVMGQAELAKLQGQPPSAGNGPSSAVAASGAPPAKPAGPVTGAAPTPASPNDVAAIQNLPADQQIAVIEGMVSSLATRLGTNSDDAAGWAELIRSYAVLKRPDDARAALARARTALASDKDKIAIVDSAARSAGLTQ